MWKEGASSAVGNNPLFQLQRESWAVLPATIVAYINEKLRLVQLLAELALTHRQTFLRVSRAGTLICVPKLWPAFSTQLVSGTQQHSRNAHCISFLYLGCNSPSKLLCYPLQDCNLEQNSSLCSVVLFLCHSFFNPMAKSYHYRWNFHRYWEKFGTKCPWNSVGVLATETHSGPSDIPWKIYMSIFAFINIFFLSTTFLQVLKLRT